MLSLFRIPGNGTPILFLHGLEDSSDSWILRGKGSLGIKLTSKGYDCWFANFRGNRYSRKHVTINPDQERFWDFSFEEFGIYDIPALIDTILNSTHASKVNVIAHSQGTTSMFVLLSSREEYNDKVNLVINLAPMCFMENIPPPVLSMAQYTNEINDIFKNFSVNEVLGFYSAESKALRSLCALPLFGYRLCLIGILSTIGGNDAAEIESDFFRYHINNHFPAGTSRKSFAHYGHIAT
ncbi:unnamed protein product [Leptidea sinapis]|uniref:AB hydrolase-1 domain-containing protein n=1 Tax=Leptidea sinapis TaxID=189913 RepID=A0A5E4R706_9NEOP|nr:unnamed protein product [Leptidea sinapis]